jgi:hypothetical protein
MREATRIVITMMRLRVPRREIEMNRIAVLSSARFA